MRSRIVDAVREYGQAASTFYRRSPKVVLILLTAIVLIGIFLRFTNLGFQSLWNDELESWRLSEQYTLTGVFAEQYLRDIHPPGWQTVLYFVEKIWGSTEVTLRFPAAVFGSLAVFFMFFLGRSLYSDNEGLIATALTAVQVVPIAYSQEARPYSLLFMSVVLSTYLWVILLRAAIETGRIRARFAVPYALAAAVTMYSHYYGVLFIALQGVFALTLFARRKGLRSRVAALYAVSGLFYLPWLPAAVHQAKSKSAWMPVPDGFLDIYLYHRYFDMGSSVYVSVITVIFLLAALIYLIVRMYPLLFEPRAQVAGTLNPLVRQDALAPLVLIAWLTVPFLASFVQSIWLTPTMSYRNLMIILPAVYLIIARAITYLPIRSAGHFAAASLLVAASLYNFVLDKHYYTTPTKEQFREATYYVADRLPEYPDSAVLGFSYNPAYFNYYFRRRGARQRIDLPAGEARDIKEVQRLIKGERPRYIWFIRGTRPADPGFLAFLDSKGREIDHKEFLGTEVRLYEVGAGD